MHRTEMLLEPWWILSKAPEALEVYLLSKTAASRSDADSRTHDGDGSIRDDIKRVMSKASETLEMNPRNMTSLMDRMVWMIQLMSGHGLRLLTNTFL